MFHSYQVGRDGRAIIAETLSGLNRMCDSIAFGADKY